MGGWIGNEIAPYFDGLWDLSGVRPVVCKGRERPWPDEARSPELEPHPRFRLQSATLSPSMLAQLCIGFFVQGAELAEYAACFGGSLIW